MVDAGNARGPRTRVVLAATGVLLALGVAGCGGDGISVPSVSRSGDTIVLPSATITLPTPTRPASPEATGTQAPEETAGPTQEPTTEAPTPEPEPTTEAPRPTPTVEPSTETVTATPTATPAPTETVTETPTPTPTATQTPTPTPSPSPTSTDLAVDEPAADDEALAPWVWWLLAAGLLAAGLAAYLVPRARRRKEWAADLAADEGEVAWFAHDLLPRLQQAATPDALAGGWQVGSARVVATEDRLTGLESTAPDDAGRARARALRDAVRAARTGVEELVVAGLPGPRVAELSLLSNQLDAVLAPPGPPGPPASGAG